MVVRKEPVTSPDALALIAGLDAEMGDLYPPEEQFGAPVAVLVAADARFFVGRLGGAPVACAAYVVADAYAELKRMFVVPAMRGKGLAAMLLAHVESAARAEGVARMLLETGRLNHAALRANPAAGYVPCGPFGPYRDIPASRFFEKHL